MKSKKIDIIAILFIAGLLLALILFNGCTGIGPTGETGSLKLDFDVQMERTLMPGISLDVTQFDITVEDSSSTQVYSETVASGDTVIVDGLLEDDYTVTVIGLNDNSTALGEGSDTVTVSVGQTTQANIVVTEYSGNGTLDLDVTWDTGIVADPRIESSLKYGNETPADISADWTLGTDAADYFNDAMLNGFHTVVFKLFDDGATETSAGFATLARIAKGETTSGSIHLEPNSLSGGIDVLISLDFYENLDVTPSVSEGSYTLAQVDDPMTIDLTTDPADGTVFSAWFKNGASVDSTSSYTIDPAALNAGETYRYDAIGITSDGKKGASLSWTIDVISIPSDTVAGTVSFDGGGGLYTYKIELKNSGNIVVQDTGFQPIPDGGGDVTYQFDSIADGEYYVECHKYYDGSLSDSFFGGTDNNVKSWITIPHSGQTVDMDITAY